MFDLRLSGFLKLRLEVKHPEDIDHLSVGCLFAMAANSLWIGVGTLRGDINALQNEVQKMEGTPIWKGKTTQTVGFLAINEIGHHLLMAFQNEEKHT